MGYHADTVAMILPHGANHPHHRIPGRILYSGAVAHRSVVYEIFVIRFIILSLVWKKKIVCD